MKLIFLLYVLTISIALGNERKNLPIHAAVEKGDKAALVSILLKDPSMLNKFDEHGYQPIHLACKFEHYELVKYLLDLGVDVNSKSDYLALSPLITAVVQDDHKTVAFLIEKGADLNFVSGRKVANSKYRSGATALSHASFNGYLKMTEFLISKGADMNVIGNGNKPRTALDVAATPEVKNLLNSKGAKKASDIIGNSK